MPHQEHSSTLPDPHVQVRPLQEDDLPAADRILRLAFGTFLGLPEPAAFLGDASYVWSRWRTDPAAAFGAVVDGTLAGSNFATRWGSVGFFGPLTIHPEHWDRGLGRRLMQPIMDCFDRWGTTHAHLFTFAASPKHVGLYQRYGFWPRFLTAVLARAVPAEAPPVPFQRLSLLSPERRAAAQEAARQLTDRILEGLDVGQEIRAIQEQGLGDTLLLWDDAGLAGLALCHAGPRTEAGSGTCYVKFAAARPGTSAERDFTLLLDACLRWAEEEGLARVVAGINVARRPAYRRMLDRGFRAQMQGVSMRRPDAPGYDRPDVFLVDDGR